MNNKKKDNKNISSLNFNIETELSLLVTQKKIPSRIAQKIANKIKGLNGEISKEQLHALVNKIKDIINKYEKSYQTSNQSKLEKPNKNMKKVVEILKNLEKRITIIEEKTYSMPRIRDRSCVGFVFWAT